MCHKFYHIQIDVGRLMRLNMKIIIIQQHNLNPFLGSGELSWVLGEWSETQFNFMEDSFIFNVPRSFRNGLFSCSQLWTFPFSIRWIIASNKQKTLKIVKIFMSCTSPTLRLRLVDRLALKMKRLKWKVQEKWMLTWNFVIHQRATVHDLTQFSSVVLQNFDDFHNQKRRKILKIIFTIENCHHVKLPNISTVFFFSFSAATSHITRNYPISQLHCDYCITISHSLYSTSSL